MFVPKWPHVELVVKIYGRKKIHNSDISHLFITLNLLVHSHTNLKK